MISLIIFFQIQLSSFGIGFFIFGTRRLLTAGIEKGSAKKESWPIGK